MDFCASNPVLHIKRIVYSSLRLGYQYSCDYPVVLAAGILLLFLQKLCPSLVMFLLSSSPVFLLTALLLGALLTFGEPCAPVIREETLGYQQTLSREFKTLATDCSTEEIENVAALACAEKRSESQVVCTEERSFDNIVYDTHHDEEMATSMSNDMVICAEEFSEFANTNVIVETKEKLQQQNLSAPSNVVMKTSNVVVKTEDQAKEIGENVELEEFKSINTKSYHNEVPNRYQLGELMSSCWQPVIRQDPCSDSESDISGSSSDASKTDIILILDELNPPVNLDSDYPPSTFIDRLNSSSDDEDDSEEDGDHGSNGAEEKKNDKKSSENNNDIDSSDTEKVSNVDSLMERRRAKNILKFDLDMRLMDMQAADAIQKMEEASHFRVQVPSISTSRPKPFDPSDGLEETAELPQILDSAPSVLLPWRKPFDIPFDQMVDHEKKFQETWTPRSYFPSSQHRKHGNLYLRQSTYLQHDNGVMTEKPEVSRNDARDSCSDSDCEQTGNNGKLFGSLEAHTGEEIKIKSTAISDACVLEANYEVDDGKKNANLSDASEEQDSVPADSEQLALCSVSKGNIYKQHIVEEDSISEANLLFKCRMEEVLVQSISESGIGQPLTVKLEDELNGTLSADSGMLAVEASSVEELNSRISQLTKETLTCAASDHTCDDELPVLEASSVEESFKNIEEEVHEEIYPRSVYKFGEEGETCSDMLVLEAKPIEDITSAFEQLGNGHDIKLSHSGELNSDQEDINPGLNVISVNTTNDEIKSDSGFKVTELKGSPE